LSYVTLRCHPSFRHRILRIYYCRFSILFFPSIFSSSIIDSILSNRFCTYNFGRNFVVFLRFLWCRVEESTSSVPLSYVSLRSRTNNKRVKYHKYFTFYKTQSLWTPETHYWKNTLVDRGLKFRVYFHWPTFFSIAHRTSMTGRLPGHLSGLVENTPLYKKYLPVQSKRKEINETGCVGGKYVIFVINYRPFWSDTNFKSLRLCFSGSIIYYFQTLHK